MQIIAPILSALPAVSFPFVAFTEFADKIEGVYIGTETKSSQITLYVLLLQYLLTHSSMQFIFWFMFKFDT